MWSAVPKRPRLGGATGYLKDLIGKDTFTGDGATDHAYIPRFNHERGKKDYVGGWGMQMNYASWQWPHHAKSVVGFGSNYKRRVRDLQPAMFQIGAWGRLNTALTIASLLTRRRLTSSASRFQSFNSTGARMT